jgi:hypothetical protein
VIPAGPHRRPARRALILAALLACTALRADDAGADTKTLLARWTEALGGRERLAQIRGGYVRESLSVAGAPTVEETWFDATGAHRSRHDSMGRVNEVTFDGRHGWRMDFTGRVSELTGVADETQDAYFLSCSALIPGRRPGAVAAAKPDSEGHEALKLQARGGYAETFYFDRDTGLPIKVVRDYGGGHAGLREYRDWREVGGVRLPFTTIYWNGARRDTARITEARWLDPPPAFTRPAPGPNPWRITDGKVARDIPIEINNNHIHVHGVMQGRDSVRITLDSGSGGDVMLASRARALGLEERGTHQALGGGGFAAASTVTDVTLTIPGLSLEHHTFDTLPLDQIGPQAGRAIDAIVGYPLFSRNVVEIDYEHERMTVYEGDDWTYQGHGAVLPLTFEDDLPYVQARITLNGGRPIEGRFELDTGNAGNLILAPDWVEKHRALATAGPTIEIVARGIGGENRSPIGRVASLELGGVRLERPVAMFRGPGAGEISAPGTAGNIGGGILRRFKVIFDYPRKRLILEPNGQTGDPFEYDMSGLGLRAMPPAYDHITVGLVLPNSPASELGIVPGDEIETIDGRAPAAMGLDAVRKRFRVAGTSFQIGIRHGEEHRTVTLTTRRLI